MRIDPKELAGVLDGIRKINLIYKDPSHPEQLNVKGFVNLTVNACVFHGEKVQKLHQRTPHFAMICIGPKSSWDVISPIWESENRPHDLIHLVGRVDLTLKLLDGGINKIQWEHPEAGLHPEWQLGLADLLIKLSEEYEKAS